VNGRLSFPEKGLLVPLGLAVALACAALMLFVVSYVLSGVATVDLVVGSPGSGSIVTVGESLVVHAVSTGRGLVKSELLVDGTAVDSLDSPRVTGLTDWSITHSWVAQPPGQHRISVRVTDLSGFTMDSRSLVVAVAPSGRIAFASNRSGTYEIYTMPTDGSRSERMISGPEEKREPSCSATGAVLYSSRQAAGGADVNLVQPETGETSDLTASLGRDRSPRWAPHGEAVAFVSDRYGLSQLFLMNPDGSGQAQLTEGDTPAEQPSWAPDGSALVFCSQSEGNWDVYRVSVQTGTVSRLTEDPGQDSYPAWSPHGDQIAFTSNREGSQQIYVMDADGTDQRRITSFPLGAEQAQWSADGEWIVCVAYTGLGQGLDSREIYLIRRDGTDQMRLTDNAFDDTEPVWCE
jgi:Tol biopolymer transport system component